MHYAMSFDTLFKLRYNAFIVYGIGTHWYYGAGENAMKLLGKQSHILFNTLWFPLHMIHGMYNCQQDKTASLSA